MSVLVRVLVSTKEQAQHSAAAHHKNNENETEISERKKYPFPLSCSNFLPDWNTIHPVNRIKIKIIEHKRLSLSLVRRPPRDHLATDSVRVKLSFLSATVSPVARLT